MAWTRASQLQRTIQCVGSAHLYNTVPAVRLARKSDNALNAAEYGTIAHYWKQHGKLPDESSTGNDDRFRSACKTFEKKLRFIESRGISRENIWPVGGETPGYHEVSVAFNCIDRRVSIAWEGGNPEWKMAHGPPWITGTCDWAQYFSDTKKLLIDDLKTGAMFDDEPDEMAQMYLYSVCFARQFNPDVIMPTITLWPKYPIENEPERIEPEVGISPKQITLFEDLLIKKYGVYRTKPDTYKLGDECVYCPAASICPLQTKGK